MYLADATQMEKWHESCAFHLPFSVTTDIGCERITPAFTLRHSI